ncbi:ATP-binding cassette transporter abc4, partial [Neolecta irregularis DAH-3]
TFSILIFAYTFLTYHKTGEQPEILRGLGLLLSILLTNAILVLYGISTWHAAMSWQPARHILARSIETAFWGYLILLHSATLIPNPHRRQAYRHAIILGTMPLFNMLFRDIYPLFQIHRHHSGSILMWIQFSLVCLVNFIPLITPRIWTPSHTYSIVRPHPEQFSNPFSRFISIWYIETFLWKGWKRTPDLSEIPPTQDDEHTAQMYLRIREDRTQNTLLKCFVIRTKDTIAAAFIFALGCSVSGFVSIISLNRLLAYLENPRGAHSNPYLWATGILAGPIINGIFSRTYYYFTNRFSSRLRTVMSVQVYEKILRSNISNQTNKDLQEKQAIVDEDINNLIDCRDLLLLSISSPIQIGISIYFLHKLLFNAAFIGSSILFVGLLLPTIFLFRYMSPGKVNINRIDLVTKLIQNLGFTKITASESSAMDQVKTVREAEERFLWHRNKIFILCTIFRNAMPWVALLAMFSYAHQVQRTHIRVSIAFSSLALIIYLRNTLLFVFDSISSTWSCYISLGRILDFINSSHGLDEASQQSLREGDLFEKADQPPCFRNATFSNGNEGNFLLQDLNVQFVKGGLNLITGQTKTTLLSGSYFLPGIDGVSFVSQDPWLQDSSIRDNILFGEIYNESRYAKVLRACALLDQVETLENGDETNANDVNMSMRIRIALARAVFSFSQVVLIDDIFSLEDDLARTIVRNCLSGSILMGRTVILATNRPTHIEKYAHKVIELYEGRIIRDEDQTAFEIENSEDTSTDNIVPIRAHTVGSNSEKSHFSIEGQDGLEEGDSESVIDLDESNTISSLKLQELGTKEQYKRTRVWTYFFNIGSRFRIFLIILLILLAQLAALFTIYGLCVFANNPAIRRHHGHRIYMPLPELTFNSSFALLGCLFASNVVFSSLAICLLFNSTFGFSQKLHGKFTRLILFSSVNSSEVMTFPQDISVLDFALPVATYTAIAYFFSLIVVTFAIPVFMPLIVFPMILLLAPSWCFTYMYLRTQASLVHIETTLKAPIPVATSVGVATIRAFRAEDQFLEDSFKRFDNHNRVEKAHLDIDRLIAFVAALLAIHPRSLPVGLIAFIIYNTMGLSRIIIGFLGSLSTTIAHAKSFQRLQLFNESEQDPKPHVFRRVTADWPVGGSVTIQELSFRQDAEKEILSDVSIHIASGDHVAIIGPGGSELLENLMRFKKRTRGSIKVDGVDVENVNLGELRFRVCFVSSDPMLFEGTVRSNLDHSKIFDDSILLQLLQNVGFSKSLPRKADILLGRSILDEVVLQNGSNFSLGQRQILSLSRALLRRSKLLVLDNTTSSVDLATEHQIIQYLRKIPDLTVVAVTSSVGTALEYDRVIVLKDGKVVEDGFAATMIEDQSSIFYKSQSSDNVS